jgi:predicted dehydrogenase
METIGVGLIGCGNISSIYLTNLPRSPGVAVRAVADLKPEVAATQAKKFGVEALSVDALLSRDDVHLIVNLTVPDAHAAVSIAALTAGKHVFSEKPLAIEAELGRKVVEEAEARGLMLGCAPDTFLGAGGRLARKLVDEGAIGRVLAGTAFIMSHGMEHWHPDPEFFFKRGGGPVLDVGPYYVTALINLLGPVARVLSVTGTGFLERIVTSEGPRKGHRIAVETPTTAMAVLEFSSGAQVLFGASWDVWKHSHPPIELYGTEGTMRAPDPNFFGGVVEISERGGDFVSHDTRQMPLGAINYPADAPRLANHRALGVAEMAAALRNGRRNHASGRLALHALEVMEAIVAGTGDGRPAAIKDGAERPPVLTESEAAGLFAR